jgi:hypothetical protein
MKSGAFDRLMIFDKQECAAIGKNTKQTNKLTVMN